VVVVVVVLLLLLPRSKRTGAGGFRCHRLPTPPILATIYGIIVAITL
jgi:hypothetical protein